MLWTRQLATLCPFAPNPLVDGKIADGSAVFQGVTLI
jgi:hypothetical protein